MTSHAETSSATAAKASMEQEMAEYGITRVSHDYFHCGGFRYTNLDDAIEQAKRLQRRAPNKG